MTQNHPVAAGLRLYVEQDNAIAMRAYAAPGMHETRYVLFEQEFSGISG